MSLPALDDPALERLEPLEPHEERYRSLLDAARGLFLLVTLDDLVRHILAKGPSILQCAACSLYLPDPKTRELIIYSARGEADPSIHTARIPWERGIAGRVFQTRQPVCLADAHDDSAFLGEFDLKSGFRTRAVLCLPLLYKDECFGVIQVLNPLHAREFSEFDRTIMEGMAAMTTSAVMRLERDREIKTIARLSGEIAAAEEIQRSLLPPEEVLLPGRGLLLARYQPARTLGGDFYAIESLQDGSVLAAVGDVSGKGIPAALTTAQIITEIGVLASRPVLHLAEFVTVLNRHLCARISAGRFIATTFLRYVPADGMMEVVRAGQFPPWRNRDGQWEPFEAPAGVPLGVDPEARFSVESVTCQPGEHWALFTDGITEGRNRTHQEYGDERFQASLLPLDPYRTLETVWQHWRRFIVEDALHDDACVVLFTCLPPVRIDLPARPSSCKRARHHVETWARAAGFPEEERGKIVLATDEAVTNLIRHGHCQAQASAPAQLPAGHEPALSLSGGFDRQEFRLTLRAEAPFVDLNTLAPRPLDWQNQPLPGGLGLHYIRTVFDRVECRQEGDFSVTVLIKKLPSS